MAEAITLEDVDEALRHANRIPAADRGPLWQSFVDRLLDDRNRLEAS